jgi:3-isopropylmalate/(R)-2-methylmalate dehydratase small subunit
VTHGAEFEARFEIDPFTKHRLLSGLDDIGLTMQYADDITAFETTRPSYKPSLT